LQGHHSTQHRRVTTATSVSEELFDRKCRSLKPPGRSMGGTAACGPGRDGTRRERRTHSSRENPAQVTLGRVLSAAGPSPGPASPRDRLPQLLPSSFVCCDRVPHPVQRRNTRADTPDRQRKFRPEKGTTEAGSSFGHDERHERSGQLPPLRRRSEPSTAAGCRWLVGGRRTPGRGTSARHNAPGSRPRRSKARPFRSQQE
jgi:hypothetical protein